MRVTSSLKFEVSLFGTHKPRRDLPHAFKNVEHALLVRIIISSDVFEIANPGRLVSKGGSYGNKILYKNLKFFDKTSKIS